MDASGWGGAPVAQGHRTLLASQSEPPRRKTIQDIGHQILKWFNKTVEYICCLILSCCVYPNTFEKDGVRVGVFQMRKLRVCVFQVSL